MFHAHVEWLSLRPLHLIHFPTSSSSLAFCTSFCISPSFSVMLWITSPHTSAEELGTLAAKYSSTCYEPNDHFITEAYVECTQESSSKQRLPVRLRHHLRSDAPQCVPKTSRLWRRRSCRLVCRRRQWVTIELGNLLFAVTQVTRKVTKFRDRRTLNTHRLGLFWTDRASKSSPTVRRKSGDTNSRLTMTEEVFKNWVKRSSRDEKNFIGAQAEGLHRRDQQFLHEQVLKQNWDLRAAHERSLTEMEELQKFQSSTFDTIARRRLVEEQDILLELTRKIQQLQDEINCMNDSRFSRCWIRTQWTFPRFQSNCVFPTSSDSWRNAQPFCRMPSRREGPPSIWGHAWYIGKRWANPDAASSAPYPQELNPWSSEISEPIRSSTAEKNENQTPVQDQRCQSGQSAKIQSSSVQEILQRIMELTNNDCRYQIFISTSSLHQQLSLAER